VGSIKLTEFDPRVGGVIPFFEQQEHFFKEALNKPSPAGRGLGESLLDQSVAQIAFPTGD
jgi:hypothetical protein